MAKGNLQRDCWLGAYEDTIENGQESHSIRFGTHPPTEIVLVWLIKRQEREIGKLQD